MMVVNTNAPLCGRRQKDGADAWAPGSLAFVGGTQWVSTLKAWGEEIKKRNPGPQKVIVLAGPKGNAQSENASTALKDIQKQNPEFQVVTTVYTNFSTPDAQKKMQDALQAHPETTIVASIYSETTKGTVVALKQAGKLGKVKIYDVGADSTVVPLIEKGQVEMTFPYYPKSMGRSAIDALYNARIGKPYKKVYANDGHEAESLRKPGAPLLFVDKSNVKAWKSSGLSEY
jgi:ribose transport system substrate-binding protein